MLSVNGETSDVPTSENHDPDVECNLFFEEWKEDKYDRLIIQIENISPSLLNLFSIPSVLRSCGIESFTKEISGGNLRFEIQIPAEVNWNNAEHENGTLEEIESRNGIS